MTSPDREGNPGSQQQEVALVQWAFCGHQAQGAVENRYRDLKALRRCQLPDENRRWKEEKDAMPVIIQGIVFKVWGRNRVKFSKLKKTITKKRPLLV